MVKPEKTWCVSASVSLACPFASLASFLVVVLFEASCAVEGLFDYTGWGVWTSVALVRVYRSWKILVRHSVDMYPPMCQVLLISIPWL